MHVDDVAGAFAALVDADYKGAVNIASGDCRPLLDVIAEIGRQTGRQELLRIGARPMQPGEPPRLEADISILRDKVGFRPRYNLVEGIADRLPAGFAVGHLDHDGRPSISPGLRSLDCGDGV